MAQAAFFLLLHRNGNAVIVIWDGFSRQNNRHRSFSQQHPYQTFHLVPDVRSIQFNDHKPRVPVLPGYRSRRTGQTAFHPAHGQGTYDSWS